MSYHAQQNVNSAYHQQADADAIAQAQAFQKAQRDAADAADAARKAQEIAEEQRRQAIAAAAGHAAVMGWSSQRR